MRMSTGKIHLPYFDCILERLRDGDTEVAMAFSQYVHWGYWDAPSQSDGSLRDFAEAAEQMSRQVIAAGRVQDGQRVLDVGCGFGGTLADLDAHFSDVDLYGLNIDARQLDYARRRIAPRVGNRVTFVAGNACRLPFADALFDVVLCVEAVFHFPGRDQFLAEARRVLRPGGRLVLSDFVPRLVIPLLWDYFDRRFKPLVTRLYGPSDMRCTLSDYRRLAFRAGLRLTQVRDITLNTIPSYRVLRPLVRRIAPDPDGAEEVIRRVQFTMRIGLLRYLILTFRI
jgi:ubiquinone/menaquinone biosynthesis C-methylase UbiE